MTQKVSGRLVLAYDLGGTKVHVAVINERGKIIRETREPVVFDQGKAAVIRQLADIGRRFLEEFPKIRRVGMASAGPLDPAKGILLDPTNFVSKEGTWGPVPLASLLSKQLKRRVFLENDAAAAMLAEHWIGAARGYKDSMILTLGTGLGTGIMINNQLLRGGRGAHPEAGHMIVGFNDLTAPCGCGNFGCAEAYISGRNFTRRTRTLLSNPEIHAVEIADLARKGDARALAAFEEYSRVLAAALHNYVMIFAPQIIVFTGSFAAASDLFLESTRKHLEQLLIRRRKGVDFMPKLALSKLHNNAGVVGGAFVAFHRK